MVSCEGCGASIDANERACPYCGHVVVKRADAFQKDSACAVIRDEDGTSKIRFGDGVAGRRPSTGAGARSAYRSGAGSAGNVPKRIVEKLDKLYDKIKKVPDPSKGKGSKDLGRDLIEAFSVMGDLLALYQSGIAQEAYLDTKDRERVSKGEKKVIPKLRQLVHFCEKVDAKTQQKIGLSDAHLQEIRTASTTSLRMLETALCTRCGAINELGSRKCRNCGSAL